MKKFTRVLISVLALTLIMAFMPGMAFAEDEAAVTAKVKVTAAYPGGFDMLDEEVEASSDLVETYFSGIEEPTGQVTVADALVAAHLLKYGDAFKADPTKYMNLGNKDWMSMQFEHTNVGYYLVNGKAIPTGVNSDTVKTGDVVYAQSYEEDYNEPAAAFDKAEYDVAFGDKLTVKLSTVNMAGETIVPKTAELSFVTKGDNFSTTWTAAEAEYKDGSAELSFAKPGTYYISATGAVAVQIPDYSAWPDVTYTDGERKISAPVAIVNVIDSAKVKFTAGYPGGLDIFDEEVIATSDLTESYFGIQETPGAVTVCDALVAAHILKYGDAFKADPTKYMNLGNKDWMSMQFGHTNVGYYLVNGKGIPTGVNSDTVKTGDVVYAESYEEDYNEAAAFFDKNEYSAVAGKPFTVKLQATGMSGETIIPSKAEFNTVSREADLSGRFVPISANYKEDGSAELKFDKAGTYYISATGEVSVQIPDYSAWPDITYTAGARKISAPLAKVTVKAATVTKKTNPMTAKAKPVKIKVKKLKKKAQTIKKTKAFTVKKNQGKVTFKKVKGNKKITVSKAGKVTVKKGLKKGTYKVVVTVKAAGNANYKAASKKVTLKIKVVK